MKNKIIITITIIFSVLLAPLSNFNFVLSGLGDSNDFRPWVKTNGPYGGNIHTIEFDPLDPNVIYAGGKGGVLKSTDNGTNWSKTGEFLFGSKISNSIVDLLIPSSNSQILYALSSSHQGGDLHRSLNGGLNWTEIDGDLTFECIAIHPNNPSIIAGGAHESSVFYTNNFGDTWSNITGNLPKDRISDIEISSSGEIWIGTYNGFNGSLYNSSNYGASWDQKDIGQPDYTGINSLVISSGSKEVFFTSLISAIDKSPNMSDPYLFKSEDGGNVWLEQYPKIPVKIIEVIPSLGNETIYASQGSNVYKSNDGYNWVTLNFSSISRGDIIDIAVDPRDNNILYLPPGGYGIMKSIDGGMTWTTITQGLDNVGVALFAVPNVNESDVVYISSIKGEGTFKTENAGESWIHLNEGGIKHDWADELMVNPHNPDNVWQIGDTGEISISNDGGLTWNTVVNAQNLTYRGFRYSSIQALAPAPSDNDVIYAVKSGFGIFRTEDGGNAWNFLRHSEVDYTYTLAVHPSNPFVVYSGYNPKPFQDWAMVRKTTDGGESWQTVLNVTGSKGITSVVIDPEHPDTVYAGSVSEEGGEIYKTIDGGQNWTKLNDNFTMCTVMGQPQLIVDTNNPLNAYIGTWLAGTWNTKDGGNTWTLLNNAPVSATDIIFDSQNSDIIYIGDRTAPIVWKSVDGGLTWIDIADFSNDSAYLVNRLYADGNTIYCATFGPGMHDGKFYKTTDSGSSWQDITGILPRSVLDIAVDPTNPEIVYVATHIRGAYKSIDGGISWIELSNFPDIGAFDIEIDPEEPSILYTSGLGNQNLPDWVLPENNTFVDNPGVYQSLDSGLTWNSVLNTSAKCRAIRVHPNNSSVLYAAVMFDGLMVSTDSGVNWTTYNTDLDSTGLTSLEVMDDKIYVGTQGYGVYAGDINPDFSVTWQADRSNKPIPQVYNMQIVVDPTNTDRIYVGTYPGGLYRSDDGGLTFYDKNFLTPSVKADDPLRQGYYAFALNPNNTSEVWLGTWGHGMFKSYNSMDANIIAHGLDMKMLGKHVYQVLIDPSAPHYVYVATEEGIFRSDDDGDTWITFNNGLDTSQVRTLAFTANGTLLCGTLGYELYAYNTTKSTWEQMNSFDRFGTIWPIWNDRPLYQYSTLLFHPTDPNVVLVGIFPAGIYKSSDAGNTWRESNTGFSNDGVFSLETHPIHADIIFAGTYNGISRSLDGGEHWEFWNDGWPEQHWVFSIDFNHVNPDIIYACSKNGENEGNGRPGFYGTVMKSINGGMTWFNITNGLNLSQEFYEIIVDKNNPNILYLATQNEGVFISHGGGDIWEPWNEGLTNLKAGTNGNNVAKPMIQSVDGKYVYFGSDGSGVYRRDLFPEVSPPASISGFALNIMMFSVGVFVFFITLKLRSRKISC
jgi:photosystem II stability/assembly factor-like uncharacterized protein